jgi:hypothetical protein
LREKEILAWTNMTNKRNVFSPKNLQNRHGIRCYHRGYSTEGGEEKDKQKQNPEKRENEKQGHGY